MKLLRRLAALIRRPAPVINVHVHGSVRSDRDILRMVTDELQRARRWDGR